MSLIWMAYGKQNKFNASIYKKYKLQILQNEWQTALTIICHLGLTSGGHPPVVQVVLGGVGIT